MSVEQISIPSYTRKQENFNALSHFLGILLALIVLVFTINKFANNEISLLYATGLTIFAVSMLAVYLISGIYHYLDKDNYYKKVFRVLDHCTIYLLIAGTYTPICFVMASVNIMGSILVISQWAGAIIGIILNLFFFENKVCKIISFILYVVMGWLVMFTGGFIYLPSRAFAFILAGGITYTIGSILYALGHKNMNLHCVFHVFVLVSTLIQMIGVMLLF